LTEGIVRDTLSPHDGKRIPNRVTNLLMVHGPAQVSQGDRSASSDVTLNVEESMTQTRWPARHTVARAWGALVCVTALTVLTGCGGSTAKSASSGPVTLNVWVRAAADSQKSYQMIFDEFTKKTGVKVKVFSTLTDFETKLNAAAAGRKLPDVVVDDAAQQGNFQKLGIIREVDRKAIAGQKDLSDAAWKSAQDASGKYLAIPFSAQANLLFVRSDWLKKLNLKAPTNWAEMVSVAKAFTTQDPDGNGVNDTYGMTIPGATTRGYISWNWSTYLWQSGADYVNTAGGKVTPVINSAKAVEAAKWYEGLFCTDKVVQPGALNAVSADANKAFQTGVTGMYLTGPYAIRVLDATAVKGKYEVLAPPAGPANAETLAEGTNIYMMAGSKQEKASQQLAEFMITPAAQKIGMVGTPAASVVRLPVNTTVDAKTVYKDDPRWAMAQQVYTASAHYEPVSMPQWQEFRQAASDTLNDVISKCGDPKAALDQLNVKYQSLLLEK
jgi:multiple sugar transport system substrate-binding protein